MRVFVSSGLGGGLTAPLWNSHLNRHFFAEDEAHYGPADAVSASNLAEAVSTLPVTKDGFAVEIERSTTDMPAFEFRAPHAGSHSFDD